MERPLIGIAGRAGAGKSTIAKHLEHNRGFHRFAFANELKYLATRMGWDGEKDERGRRLLQHLGDVGREYDVDCWIRLVMRSAQGLAGPVEHGPATPGAVIEDCRYTNECRAILSRPYGVVLFVDRPGNPHKLTGENGAHSSEALSYLDLVQILVDLRNEGRRVHQIGKVRMIHNTGGEVHLAEAVDAALQLGDYAPKAVQA